MRLVLHGSGRPRRRWKGLGSGKGLVACLIFCSDMVCVWCEVSWGRGIETKGRCLSAKWSMHDDGHARRGAEANLPFCPAGSIHHPMGVFPCKRAGQIYFRTGQWREWKWTEHPSLRDMSRSRYNHFNQFIIVIYLTSVETSPKRQSDSLTTSKTLPSGENIISCPNSKPDPDSCWYLPSSARRSPKSSFTVSSHEDMLPPTRLHLYHIPSLSVCFVGFTVQELILRFLSSLFSPLFSLTSNPRRLVRQRTHPPPNLLPPRIQHRRPFHRTRQQRAEMGRHVFDQR